MQHPKWELLYAMRHKDVIVIMILHHGLQTEFICKRGLSKLFVVLTAHHKTLIWLPCGCRMIWPMKNAQAGEAQAAPSRDSCAHITSDNHVVLLS